MRKHFLDTFLRTRSRYKVDHVSAQVVSAFYLKFSPWAYSPRWLAFRLFVHIIRSVVANVAQALFPLFTLSIVSSPTLHRRASFPFVSSSHFPYHRLSCFSCTESVVLALYLVPGGTICSCLFDTFLIFPRSTVHYTGLYFSIASPDPGSDSPRLSGLQYHPSGLEGRVCQRSLCLLRLQLLQNNGIAAQITTF